MALTDWFNICSRSCSHNTNSRCSAFMTMARSTILPTESSREAEKQRSRERNRKKHRENTEKTQRKHRENREKRVRRWEYLQVPVHVTNTANSPYLCRSPRPAVLFFLVATNVGPTDSNLKVGGRWCSIPENECVPCPSLSMLAASPTLLRRSGLAF